MVPKNNCFLETTAVIDYIRKTKKFEDLKVVLKGYDKKITANYVKMEIKRGFLQHLVYLHGKLIRSNNLFEVYESIHNLSSTPQKNKLATVLQEISDFYKKMQKNHVESFASQNKDIKPADIANWEKERIELSLRSIIRRFFKKIDASFDEIINPMNCYSDISAPIETKHKTFDNTPSQCTGSAYACNIKKFFEDNTESFQKIHKKLQKIVDPDNETTVRISSMKKIFKLINNNRKFSNQEKTEVKRCWHCGDAILAVTAPDDHDVINNNTKHYKPICDAISKTSQSY